jgi:hypothetical protein
LGYLEFVRKFEDEAVCVKRTGDVEAVARIYGNP